MALGDVTLALAAEFNLPTEIGTGKRGFDNDLLFRAIQTTEDRLKEPLIRNIPSQLKQAPTIDH
jgi:hypothetical protein